jgi:phenylpropionate dioxygenase-like ring-hydroxylating dioxygenase large terminal subunit
MYINFWYPIAESEKVTNDDPVRVRILGVDLVTFRDTAGQAHVLSDTCIHRGGSLGKGTVKGDCVTCPYHGWEFNGAGHCTHIPSLGESQHPPARAKVDTYPTEERYGILFAFLGDLPADQRPPIYDITEFEDPDWRANRLVVFEVDYYYERSVENGLDPAHNEFVHPKQGAPGMRQDFRNKPIDVEPMTDWGSKFIIPFIHEKADTALLAGAIERDVEYLRGGSGHLGPNQLVTWLQFSKDNIFHQYFFEAPIDQQRTRIFFVNMRHFMLEDKNDERLVSVNMEIAQEDIDVLVELNPVTTPHNTTKELLVPADRPLVRYREFLREWDSKGWRINVKELEETRNDVAYAIPCPERRTTGNWILDTIPTL